ncbi:hypothetical protein Tco_1152509 [Tanacetum coccineum]
MVVPVSSIKPVETPTHKAQPISTIIPSQPESSQAPKRVDKGKRIAIDDVESQMINGKMHYLTNDEITEYLEKEELIKKAAERSRLLAITKPEVVKVVREEAEKIGIDLERIRSVKEGEKKHKFENYMWTIGNRLKPEKITVVKIHPHTKAVVVTVYRGTDRKNFEVHNPFAFGAFGITKLDELREIILKKKNIVVKD